MAEDKIRLTKFGLRRNVALTVGVLNLWGRIPPKTEAIFLLYRVQEKSLLIRPL